MATALEVALEYAQRGWPVFPVHHPIKGKCSCGWQDCSNPAKHPMTRNGLKDATTDLKQIRSWWTKSPQANIGIATGQGSGLVVLDIDPRHGGLESMKAIGKLGNMPSLTPTVYTGGGGEHIYLAYPNNGIRISNTVELGGYPGLDLRGEGGYVIAPPSRHISGSKYTWKVRHLGKSPAKMPEWFAELAAPRRGHEAPHKGGGMPSNNNIIISSRGGSCDVSIYPPHFCDAKGFLSLPVGTRDNTLFEIATALKRGGMPKGKVNQIIATLGEKACSEIFKLNDSLKKVDSAFSDEINYSAEIRELIASQNGHIAVTDIDRELQYTTARHKASRRMVVHRLVNEGVLDTTSKAGVYRIVADKTQWMNLAEDDGQDFWPIKFPFGIENWVDIPPKGIVCIAGSKDSGKTAMALNIIAKNMNDMPIYYFPSEMGEFALKKRLKLFDWPLSSWKFKAKPCSVDFQDVIVPDALNIIDYLEVTDKFWLVSEDIRRIFDKLTTGVAVICLQKREGEELSRGKDFSREKAHLYLSLETGKKGTPNTCTIVSGKFWHQDEVNPAGKVIKYKLWKGYKLIEQEY